MDKVWCITLPMVTENTLFKVLYLNTARYNFDLNLNKPLAIFVAGIAALQGWSTYRFF
jgi:hypothetical protein